mmetsp:Transcript_19395/g.74476  ORF Transcript_19395/g.74476 Transcript_19395/m.74476 type:complete len:340 (-) Transcript_19395:29-1048(-)
MSDEKKETGLLRRMRMASRRSELAMLQSRHVKRLLEEADPGLEVEIVEMSTKGDRVLDVALSKIGDKGLFTKELEDALLADDCQLAVHSLKDMPSALPEGLCLGAITASVDCHDVVLFNPRHEGKVGSLADLPQGSVIGTSSLRRAAQLGRAYPQLSFKSIRGNMNTRLRKLDDFEEYGYDGIVVAAAGLMRMGRAARIAYALDVDTCLPAAGQGRLAVECREDDDVTMAALEAVRNRGGAMCSHAERAFLAALGGGCQVPIAALASVTDVNEKESTFSLTGRVLSIDGKECIEVKGSATVTWSCGPAACRLGVTSLGSSLAQAAIEQGAREILDSIQH